MKRLRNGKIVEVTVEEAPANNMGDGNIAIPEKPLKWDDEEDLLKRYRLPEGISLRRFMMKK